MEISDNSLRELLQYVPENVTLKSPNVELANMKKEVYVNRKHNHSIWFTEDEEVWKTYIDDANASRGYRIKESKDKSKLINHLYEYYKARDYTIEECFNDWIANKRKHDRMREQSLTRYGNTYSRFIKGTALEKTAVESITEDNLRDFIRDAIKSFDLSRKSYEQLRLILRGMFRYAKANHKTKINITDFFKDLDIARNCRPTVHNTRIYTEKEINLIVEECRRRNLPISLCAAVQMQTGLRISEVTAFRWENVNFEEGYVLINATDVQFKDPAINKRVHIVQKETKTGASMRKYYLTDNALDTLRQAYELTGEYEFCFVNLKNGMYHKDNAIREHLRDVCSKIGVSYQGTHAARASMCTNLLGNMRDEEVQHQMGHSDIMTTRKYYARFRTDGKEMREKMNEIVKY